ncbi:DUF4129 domain-containing transglutaminase family protein [Sporosarcina ureilytica]|uniref:Transglutaminase-like domain-containing protein n=1 Tax=Sporosarcina ureilytica TaxID=298596 RepID=A0A1D8JDG0_9BACL|nr:DUF4129 domain-containing transglutaminase family protein [Sporosarcina ureilytica]AOV06752.1 hypothetical protein BI350_03525 [Sporosarcina ureilytica]
MKEIQMNKWLLAFLYFLVFILLREWLLPVIALTDTSYLSLFLFFIGIAFILALMKAKWWLSIPIKAVYIFWAVQYMYVGTITIPIKAIPLVFGDIVSNVPLIFNGEWGKLSNTLRTILFFLLLWMITYLVSYWLEVKRSILLFYFSTVVFIAAVDTFSTYSAESSIFMIMVVGLLLLGILSISKISARYKAFISFRQITQVSIPLVFVLILSGVLMTFSPKLAPIWADPVPFIKSMAEGGGDGNATVSKSGYDPNDAQLGGPFLPDDSLVFEAAVANKQYWKVETKDTYTSKGWEQSNVETSSNKYFPGAKMTDGMTQQQIEESTPKYAGMTMVEKFPFIVYPYGMTTVHTEQAVTIIHHGAAGKYLTDIEGESRSLDLYDVEFVEQAYSLKQLRDTKMSELPSMNEFSAYLQLPDELPDRVRELATSITESSESVYDKAKAVERYFGRNGFVYDQKNVAVPNEEEDYVDQFLFDTKRGYCDNFSSSMVVLLRTLDIPARWVKGFAPGDPSQNDEGERVYRVSNNEAHSWVEAYMPGIGWVPFEPTIGFSGVADIDYDIELNLDDPEVREMPEQKREELEREIKEKEAKEKRTTTDRTLPIAMNEWVKDNIRWMMFGTAILFIIGWWLYVSRRRWMPKIIIPLYRAKDGNWHSFSKQYRSLLKQLDRFGLKRAHGETLAAYAEKVDRYFGGNRMQKLTTVYEKRIYGEIKESQDWQRLQEMWEDLVLKTSD